MCHHKLIIWIYLLLIAVTGRTSCSQNNSSGQDRPQETILVLSPANMDFEAAGGTKDMKIRGNSSWTINGVPGWISVSEEKGKGTITLGVTATVNEISEERTASITINADEANLSRTMTITQAAAEKPGKGPEASIPPDNSGMRT